MTSGYFFVSQYSQGLKLGDRAEFARTVSESDIDLYAGSTYLRQEVNFLAPVHLTSLRESQAARYAELSRLRRNVFERINKINKIFLYSLYLPAGRQVLNIVSILSKKWEFLYYLVYIKIMHCVL